MKLASSHFLYLIFICHSPLLSFILIILIAHPLLYTLRESKFRLSVFFGGLKLAGKHSRSQIPHTRPMNVAFSDWWPRGMRDLFTKCSETSYRLVVYLSPNNMPMVSKALMTLYPTSKYGYVFLEL